MSCDLPHVEYKKEKKQGYNQKDYDDCVAANKEIERKFLEKQAAEKGVEINLTELIQKA